MSTPRGFVSNDFIVNKDKKLASKMRFPPEFDKKVNMDKVALPVIKKWIAERILEILGFEDDIVVQFIFNMLDNAKESHQSPDPRYIQIYLTGFLEHDARPFTKESHQSPDPRYIQIYLTGFLEHDARPFTEELWTHLVTACHNAGGIPTAMLEATKKKLAMKNKTWVYREQKEKKNEGPDDSKEKDDEQVDNKEVEETSMQSAQLKEMLENIERKRKEREKKIEQIKAIPRSLADCISSRIVQKAKMQEDRERRAELKKIQAMEHSTTEKKIEVKKEKILESSTATKASGSGNSPANIGKWEVVKQEPGKSRERRSRSRSRNFRRSRSRQYREVTPSPSPSPPREWLMRKSRRSSKRRRRSSSSSRSSD